MCPKVLNKKYMYSALYYVGKDLGHNLSYILEKYFLFILCGNILECKKAFLKLM